MSSGAWLVKNESGRDAWSLGETQRVPTKLLVVTSRRKWPVSNFPFLSFKVYLLQCLPYAWSLLQSPKNTCRALEPSSESEFFWMLKHGFKGYSQIKLTETDKYAGATGQSWSDASAQKLAWELEMDHLLHGMPSSFQNKILLSIHKCGLGPENSRLCDWQLTYPIHTSRIYIYSNL